MGLETALPVDGMLTTQLQRVINWARRSAVWPMPFATACCGIELMATATSRFDLARFGAEVFRFSPRQADLLIVAGRVAVKMLPVLQRIYLQMTEPKWVISMGACASTAACSTPTPWCRALTSTSLWMCTCPVARLGRKC